MKTYIEDQWKTFVEACDIRGASETQRRDLRRTFYAGAAAFLHILGAQASDADEDADIALIQTMQAELTAFKVLVETGRA